MVAARTAFAPSCRFGAEHLQIIFSICKYHKETCCTRATTFAWPRGQVKFGHLDAGLSKFCDKAAAAAVDSRPRLVALARALNSRAQALVRRAERCSTLGCGPKEVNFFDWACRAERSPGAGPKRASRRRRPSKAIKRTDSRRRALVQKSPAPSPPAGNPTRARWPSP